MSVKSSLEVREHVTLCPYASFSDATRGREGIISFDGLRTEYQRDRDRIIHSKAFRRLMHKTQVFLCPDDDHYRTRLTHTLEVSQIARTIARSLLLNEDLAEAIALGHDLGHAPFGHAGERVLQHAYDPEFAHYKQSLRVVDTLEKLNLTFEVRDGILNHAGANKAATLEGTVVKLADRIAYINHDIDDALRAGIMKPRDIPTHLREILGQTHGERIDTMVNSVISQGVLNRSGVPEIRMDDIIGQATGELRSFLFDNVYTNPTAKGEETKASRMLETLYEYFRDNPSEIPTRYAESDKSADASRLAADFICDMTDKEAIRVYQGLFIPELWHG